MSSKKKMKKAIAGVISDLMERVINKVTVIDPFIIEEHKFKKPLYAALVPDEIFKGSHFERRFVTPFGGVWEKLALASAKEGLGHGVHGHAVEGMVKKERLRRIAEVLNNLEHPLSGSGTRIKPDWSAELKYILKGAGSKIPTKVVCDLYAEDVRRNKKYAFEIKAPLPNSDQTKVSKEKMLKLYAMEPKKIDGAFFALPYNPYGRKEDYDWSFPKRWFNMTSDPVVLIGDEFWDMVGGRGTYKLFVNTVNGMGEEYKEIIYRDFLGITPPDKDGSSL